MNRLIITEGLPGSGKSTVSRYIADSLKAVYYDEGSGSHPADYEFHAFVADAQLSFFTEAEQRSIKEKCVKGSGGYIVPLDNFSGDLFEKLLKYKIYDFLTWETERPVMLERWREFVRGAAPDKRYVFNCVLLQNPMCETMMRFGFDRSVSVGYIREICDIIKPMNPFVIYLNSRDIRTDIERTIPERGTDWLNGVIDYHCGGGYGKAYGLSGFDGYIAALEERRRRELEILSDLDIRYMVTENPAGEWDKTCAEIMERLENT